MSLFTARTASIISCSRRAVGVAGRGDRAVALRPAPQHPVQERPAVAGPEAGGGFQHVARNSRGDLHGAGRRPGRREAASTVLNTAADSGDSLPEQPRRAPAALREQIPRGTAPGGKGRHR